MGIRAASSCNVASRNCSGSKLFTALFEEFRDETGPAGLMTGADTSAIVAVKIFVKKKQVTPVRIALENFRGTDDRASAASIAQKDMDETA